MVVMLFAILGLGAPATWRAHTFYDVLPEDCRFNVSNNDVGNEAGDMYFNIKDKYLPVACKHCKQNPRGCRGSSTFDCSNPESAGNLVVRKLSVEVFGDFSEAYKLCDVWPGYNKSGCDYECYDLHHGVFSPGVGSEKVCGGARSKCDMAPTPTVMTRQKWDYWNYNTAARLGDYGGGAWYSLAAADKGKYWRNAKIVKTINQRCQARALDSLVQEAGAPCFGACPQPTNHSSLCWISCFFETVLGPDADSTLKPPGAQHGAMNVTSLVDAWLSGFHSDEPSSGGCPSCPSMGGCPDRQQQEEHGERQQVAAARRAPRAYAPPEPR